MILAVSPSNEALKGLQRHLFANHLLPITHPFPIYRTLPLFAVPIFFCSSFVRQMRPFAPLLPT